MKRSSNKINDNRKKSTIILDSNEIIIGARVREYIKSRSIGEAWNHVKHRLKIAGIL